MADPTIQRFVSECDFFSGLAPELIDFLAEHARAKRLEAGQVLFRHGDDARHFYVIAEGSVSVEVAALEGPPLELQVLEPGAVLGWSWLIAPYKWSFQARATAPTDVVEFDGTAILARCDADPMFGYELMKRFSALMSERLHFARQKMMQEWKPAGFA
jgi:CRP/FNR family transcriptional regulator, cyclic AMP receptor protein